MPEFEQNNIYLLKLLCLGSTSDTYMAWKNIVSHEMPGDSGLNHFFSTQLSGFLLIDVPPTSPSQCQSLPSNPQKEGSERNRNQNNHQM